MNHSFEVHTRSAERGAVLITGLVFLVVLLMIVVSVMRSGTLEERMASNALDRQLALQAAEAVSRDAQVAFFTTPVSPFDPFDISGFTSACTNGLCGVPAAGSTPLWKNTSAWTTTKTRTFASSASNITQLATNCTPPTGFTDCQPRYFIEPVGFEGGQIGMICPKVIYRVTARGVGKDSSTVFVETMYRYRPHSYVDGSCG